MKSLVRQAIPGGASCKTNLPVNLSIDFSTEPVSPGALRGRAENLSAGPLTSPSDAKPCQNPGCQSPGFSEFFSSDNIYKINGFRRITDGISSIFRCKVTTRLKAAIPQNLPKLHKLHRLSSGSTWDNSPSRNALAGEFKVITWGWGNGLQTVFESEYPTARGNYRALFEASKEALSDLRETIGGGRILCRV